MIEVKKEISRYKTTPICHQMKRLQRSMKQSRMKLIKKRAIGNVLFIGWLFRRLCCLRKSAPVCKPVSARGRGNLEALCKLFETIGKVLGRKKDTKKQMDIYFSNCKKMTGKDVKLPNRVKFMILDLIEMRNNQWVQEGRKRRQKQKKKFMMRLKREQELSGKLRIEK